MAILESLLLEIIWVGRVPLVLQVILMAKMLLHVLSLIRKINVSKLSKESGVSRQTLYTWAYRTISILGVSCITAQAKLADTNDVATETQIESLKERLDHLERRNQELEKHNSKLQGEIECLNTNLKQIVDKTILVRSFQVKSPIEGLANVLGLFLPFMFLLMSSKLLSHKPHNKPKRLINRY